MWCMRARGTCTHAAHTWMQRTRYMHIAHTRTRTHVHARIHITRTRARMRCMWCMRHTCTAHARMYAQRAWHACMHACMHAVHTRSAHLQFHARTGARMVHECMHAVHVLQRNTAQCNATQHSAVKCNTAHQLRTRRYAAIVIALPLVMLLADGLLLRYYLPIQAGMFWKVSGGRRGYKLGAVG